MPRFDEVVPVLRWRITQLRGRVTAQSLAQSLSNEELRKTLTFEDECDLPEKLYKGLRAFRRMGSKTRVRAAQRFLDIFRGRAVRLHH